eukprot:comp7333_c0_seq1/m.3031 comp7333_c0_seq1/g.3031  ORF comp7333_c0_seq1/g.3031 comp7333_c0_seq1/m.3031 type:complete len:282 (-) comp7333_c0_seq1:64-909(-)
MVRQGGWWTPSFKGTASALYTCVVCPGATLMGRVLVLCALVCGLAAAVQAARCGCLAGWTYQCLVTAPPLAVLGALCSWRNTKVSASSKAAGGSVVSMGHLADPHRPMPLVGTAACLLAACHVMLAACIFQSTGLVTYTPGSGPSFQFMTFNGLRFAVLVLWMLIVLSSPEKFRAVNQSESPKDMLSTNENGPKRRSWVRWLSVLPLALLGTGVVLCVSGGDALGLGLVCVLTAPCILLQPLRCPLQRLLASCKRLHQNGSWSRQAALPSTHNYVALPLDD